MRKHLSHIPSVALLIILMILGVYGTSIASSDKINVVATTTFIYDMAKNIGGPELNIVSLMPIGADPHLYNPVPNDARLIADANLILKNGLTLEGWLNELIENSGTKGRIVTVTLGIDAIESDIYANASDPHAWMDALNGIIYAENIKQAFTIIDPNNAIVYQERFNSYKKELLELDEYIRKRILEIEPDNRILVTSHDAFRYWGNQYGFQVESVLGTSTDAEVRIKDINHIIQVIKDHKLPAIFMESTINPKMMQQIAADLKIVIGGKLYADSLGDEESGASTYISMLKHNIDAITGGLTSRSSAVLFDFSLLSFIVIILLVFIIVFVIVAIKVSKKVKEVKDFGTVTLTINRLTVSYAAKTALSNINLKIEQGKIYGIIGPNGSGKSTLLKSILGLIPIDSGSILLNGQEVDKFLPYIAYIPQKEDVDWDFPATVMDVVLMGRYPYKGTFERISRADKELAYLALEKVGIEDLPKRQIGELSGGQQQRVFLARALCQHAEIYLLDEPMVGVDITTEQRIISILKDLAAAGKTILIIHHDLSKVEEYFDELIMLNQRLIAAGPTSQVFIDENIMKTYSGRLTILQDADKYVNI